MVNLNPTFFAYTALSTSNASSSLTTTNYLQPNSFKMTINRKNFPNLEFFCQSILHPDMNMPAAELQYQRVANIPMPGDKINFGELTCMIILDEELNSYSEMYNWMKRMVSTPQSTRITKENQYLDNVPPTHADINISILSSSNNVTRQIRYIDCIPVGLGNIQFESTAGGDTFITYPASFRFSYFDFK